MITQFPKMNIRILLSAILLLGLFSCATVEQGEARVTYKELDSSEGANGAVIMKYKGSNFNGIAYSTFENGDVFTEQEFIDGEKNGKYSTYHSNGQKKTSGKKIDGKEEGDLKEWYENGQQKYLWVYRKGLKHGKWFSWYEDGTKWTERDFENGILNGKVMVWDEQGKLAKEYTYVNGNQTASQVYKDKWEEKAAPPE